MPLPQEFIAEGELLDNDPENIILPGSRMTVKGRISAQRAESQIFNKFCDKESPLGQFSRLSIKGDLSGMMYREQTRKREIFHLMPFLSKVSCSNRRLAVSSMRQFLKSGYPDRRNVIIH
jgi:hypothetical protein